MNPREYCYQNFGSFRKRGNPKKHIRRCCRIKFCGVATRKASMMGKPMVGMPLEDLVACLVVG